MRVLARHQWVREHGTPRLSTILDAGPRGQRLWRDWLRLRGDPEASTHRARTSAGPRGLERLVRQAYDEATARPRQAIAVLADPSLAATWLASGDDRLRAWVREGLIEVGAAVTATPAPRPASARAPSRRDRARSLAEWTLFEALEATPATAGRFALNQRLAVRFGPDDAEVDLLSRELAIAIEVDGFHHFTDAAAYRRDRRKDALLQTHGLTVLRVLADDVLADPRDAVRMVLEVLGHQLRTARQPRRAR
ncbi:MAG: DUF559 domain-containing protein [Kofleriaceae bacterium]|nr:DUF559 domain-containing protein [Kofleriaceae bacterium]